MQTIAIAIIVSQKDPAGMTIKQQLLKNYGFQEVKDEIFDGGPVFDLQIEESKAKLFTIKSEAIYSEDIDKRIQADIFVFATKHFSRAGIPALTTHSIGNWSKADFGGKDKTICQSPAFLIKLFLQNLVAVSENEKYEGETVQEATHHGPYLEKPAVFIEVGSTEKQWTDPKLASMIADSLIGGLGDYIALKENYEPVMGLGGMHYASHFKKLMLNTELSVTHICPKHHLPSLTLDILKQAMASSVPEAKKVALDWKGLGKEKHRIKELLENNNIEYFRV
jgi:D-aminoacyl-tRNA deacylase